MSLVNAQEVAKAINIDKYGLLGKLGGWSIMKLLRISRLNKIYDRNKHKEGTEFLDAILDDLNVKFEIPEEDLRRIPKTGGFITISNHPLGGVDGILLLKLLLDRRPDFKIIANFLLHRIEPLKPFIMPVNPFEDHKEAQSSATGFIKAIRHLKNDLPLGIFPAGEVSTYRDGKLIVDRAWEPAAMKLIQRAEVPVIPIYFHAKNSRLFYGLAKLSDTLRTAKLPSELLTQKKRTIIVRIGNAVPVAAQKEHEDLKDFTDFLRRKTYLLSKAYDKEVTKLRDLPKNIKLPKSPPEKIIQGSDGNALAVEVENLRQDDKRLLISKNYEVFLTKANAIPNILREIGRLREITFREIGEGTNKSIDLDKYDDFYHQMFLWDKDAQCIAGAYRMGMGQHIYEEYGINGFYLNELFNIDVDAHKMMSQSIEMGRAFIIPDYQQKPMPLFLLWKGIVHCTLRFPEHKYLIGGVSISNKFSNFSKSIMIEFMKSNYYDPYLAQFIKPKKEFKVKLQDADKDFIFDSSQADLNKFDRLIDELEPNELRLPVLIKKYVKQNARVIAFNVDPLFNNAIDGLMYIRIADLPESTVKPVMEEFQAEMEAKYFNTKNEE
ncbi:GNAT family N-acyltransferase [Nonlabens ponticola]|uniref:Lysophospholipid acyltransferase family protein n=1 Tax=Nonlabens ponticola TaxID=2496866 RepID=A0A3S9MWB4_9FLAO|nr:lysophospholipid acyltransferase family protein [Nonlabens ponticola]AZQ43488.1 lysophospholipid acyltransferase family protein [Nonlabens ponticola]